LLDILIQASVFVSDRRLRREGQCQSHRAVGKWPYFSRYDFWARQLRAGMELVVNELQDADHFTAPILHGKRQQGTRPVAGFLVIMRIEVIGPITGNLAGIGQVDHLAVQGRIPGQGIFLEGHLEFGERKLRTVILSLLEPEIAFAGTGRQDVRPFLFNEIQRPCISAGDLARLRKDQVEQLANFTSLRQGNADAI
jgi:hypothetical protein